MGWLSCLATVFRSERGVMRRFVIGTVVGGFLMYFYLTQYADWRNWASGSLNDVGSKYRGDSTHRMADQALH
jgi:hypothetical protein